MANQNIPFERKAAYYAGIALIVIGFLVFGSVFVTGLTSMGSFNNFEGQMQSAGVRAILGIGLIIVGGVLRGVGARGLAGSGVILDPQQAREDVEPWARMAGGILKDAVDESGLKAGGGAPAGDAAPDFEETLRKLHKLHQDGILSREEYEQKKAEVLARQVR